MAKVCSHLSVPCFNYFFLILSLGFDKIIIKYCADSDIGIEDRKAKVKTFISVCYAPLATPYATSFENSY